MPKSEFEHMPARQFRVTLTEDLRFGSLTAALHWRTFPCRADQWAQPHWFTFPVPEQRPITSQEALRDYLGVLAAEPWVKGKYPR